jgi:serine/threonine protein kinase
MAPEIIAHKKYGKPADVWSMGILQYECMNGVPPYFDLAQIDALMCISKRGILIDESDYYILMYHYFFSVF